MAVGELPPGMPIDLPDRVDVSDDPQVTELPKPRSVNTSSRRVSRRPRPPQTSTRNRISQICLLTREASDLLDDLTFASFRPTPCGSKTIDEVFDECQSKLELAARAIAAVHDRALLGRTVSDPYLLWAVTKVPSMWHASEEVYLARMNAYQESLYDTASDQFESDTFESDLDARTEAWNRVRGSISLLLHLHEQHTDYISGITALARGDDDQKDGDHDPYLYLDLIKVEQATLRERALTAKKYDIYLPVRASPDQPDFADFVHDLTRLVSSERPPLNKGDFASILLDRQIGEGEGAEFGEDSDSNLSQEEEDEDALRSAFELDTDREDHSDISSRRE